jgi:hypothetical protein
LIVEEEDVRSLAEAIGFCSIIRIGPTKWATRRRAQKILSLESCINAYDAFYGKLSYVCSAYHGLEDRDSLV